MSSMPRLSSLHRFNRYALLALATVMEAACASRMEPAQTLIGDIEAAVNAAAPQAAKYVPEQLKDVQSQLADLKASFDKKDYAAVLAGAAPVMSAAHGLASSAAAKKEEIMAQRTGEWAGLAAALPGYVTAIESRIELLGKKSGRKLAAGIDLGAAKAGLAAAGSLWSKAQAAFAAGNLDEAVTTAQNVKTKLEALAAALQLQLRTPSAEQPA